MPVKTYILQKQSETNLNPCVVSSARCAPMNHCAWHIVLVIKKIDKSKTTVLTLFLCQVLYRWRGIKYWLENFSISSNTLYKWTHEWFKIVCFFSNAFTSFRVSLLKPFVYQTNVYFMKILGWTLVFCEYIRAPVCCSKRTSFLIFLRLYILVIKMGSGSDLI